MKKALYWLFGIVIALGLTIGSINYVRCMRPLTDAIAGDSRNEGIAVRAHLKYWMDPSTLVFDMRSVNGEKSMLDVTRVLLTYAKAMKDTKFDRVELAFQGESRFQLEGAYFQQLGVEFGEQNPMYTLRTLPEHVYDMQGEHAFGTWTGGIFGVLAKQMEDLNTFHRKWYMESLALELSPGTG